MWGEGQYKHALSTPGPPFPPARPCWRQKPASCCCVGRVAPSSITTTAATCRAGPAVKRSAAVGVHSVSPCLLAEPRVRQTEHGGFETTRPLGQDRLDLGGMHVLSARLDHVLGPAHQQQPGRRRPQPPTDVPRPQPAILRECPQGANLPANTRLVPWSCAVPGKTGDVKSLARCEVTAPDPGRATLAPNAGKQSDRWP